MLYREQIIGWDNDTFIDSEWTVTCVNKTFGIVDWQVEQVTSYHIDRGSGVNKASQVVSFVPDYYKLFVFEAGG